MATRKWTFHRGQILNPLDDSHCEYWSDGVLVLRDGRVHEILPYLKACDKYVEEFAHANLWEHPQGLIAPAFFDMHFHWVQDDVREMPKASLLEWLEKYTFPAEAKFKSPSYARRKARAFFKRLVSVGTLGGACYSSIHEHALDRAMEEVVGDVLVGNVLMTQESPEALLQTESEAVRIARRAMQKYGHRYVLTPRFAIATDAQTMTVTGAEADKRKIFKQSHLSENVGEIDFVLSQYRKLPRFKRVRNYTEIYQKTKMLGPRTLMGHAIHLSEAELKLLSRTRTCLIHCPTSNAPHGELGLGSGLFDFKRAERHGIRWALGSDIGGGPFLSMLDVMQSFFLQNRRAKRSGATYVRALYRATLAGAEILGVQQRAGNLSPGKEANFVVLEAKGVSGKNAEAVLQNFFKRNIKRSAWDRQVRATYYKGEALFER